MTRSSTLAKQVLRDEGAAPKVEIYVTDHQNNRCSYCTTYWENTENKRSPRSSHVPRETIRAHLVEHQARARRGVSRAANTVLARQGDL
jgi:molybdenum cofactor biosynthesis enzyme MoaA